MAERDMYRYFNFLTTEIQFSETKKPVVRSFISMLMDIF